MEATPPPRDPRRELRWVLEQILLKVTGRLWANPRQIQLDAGSAISLLYDVEVRNGDYLASTLSGLVRELGQRRPNPARYVDVLESFIAVLDEPPGDTPVGGAAGDATP